MICSTTAVDRSPVVLPGGRACLPGDGLVATPAKVACTRATSVLFQSVGTNWPEKNRFGASGKRPPTSPEETLHRKGGGPGVWRFGAVPCGGTTEPGKRRFHAPDGSRPPGGLGACLKHGTGAVEAGPSWPNSLSQRFRQTSAALRNFFEWSCARPRGTFPPPRWPADRRQRTGGLGNAVRDRSYWTAYRRSGDRQSQKTQRHQAEYVRWQRCE
jgi:hypothetical protein